MTNIQRAILIGGTSHVGKTSVAAELAQRLGGRHVSTDYFARHPGRPWSTPERQISPHVPTYYRGHTVEELINDVLQHYRSLWSQTEELVLKHSDLSEPVLVLEVSALLPELVADTSCLRAHAYWLRATPSVIESRILTSSRFETASADGKASIRKFIDRALAFDDYLARSLAKHGLASCEVRQGESSANLADRISKKPQ